MFTLRAHAIVAIVLGVLSIVAVGFDHLALTDIAHGEPDVSQEWLVVRASALVVLLFTALSLTTLVRLLRLRP
jgi:hypothetical protein